MEILISFTYTEKMRLLSHASETLHGGHWGSSDLIIPEQQFLYKKIEDLEGEVELTFTYVKMLIDWIYDGTHEGTHLVQEDISIINKLLKILTEFFNNLKHPIYLKLIKLKIQFNILNKLLNQNTIDVTQNNYLIIINELETINDKLNLLQKTINNQHIISYIIY